MCYRDSLHTPQSRTNSTGPSSPTNTIESLQARIDLQATQLAIKEGENVRLNGEVACLSREAERLDKEVDRVYGQVKNMNAEIKRLRVHERGMEESSLDTQNWNAPCELTDTLRDSKIQQDAMVQLTSQLSITSAELATCREQNTTLQMQLNENNDITDELAQVLKDLGIQRDESVRLTDQLANTALSWKKKYYKMRLLANAIKYHTNLTIEINRDSADEFIIHHGCIRIAEGKLRDRVVNDDDKLGLFERVLHAIC